MFDSQIQKGSSSARSDDTKSMKGPILDWIAPKDGFLDPRIARNNKSERGFHHPVTGFLLCPIEYDWSDEECVYRPIYSIHCLTLRIPSEFGANYAPPSALLVAISGLSSFTKIINLTMTILGTGYFGVRYCSQ